MSKTSAPLVTIAIPTYNRASGYLREALGSALAQSYQNVEILVSDNCSTDDTEAVVRSFTRPGLHYIRHDKNIGALGNFNFCLQRAQGSYFLLLHDDDRIDSDFVERCIETAQGSVDVGFIRTGTRRIDEDGRIIAERLNHAVGLSTEEYLRAWIAKKCAWYFCSTLFNTQLLKSIGGFHSKHQLLVDAVAFVKLACSHPRLDVKEIKASCRVHPGEITYTAKVGEFAADFLPILELITESDSVEHKAELRAEATRFFAELSYEVAGGAPAGLRRLGAYATVFRTFGYTNFPPAVTRPVRRFLANLPFSNRRRRPSLSA